MLAPLQEWHAEAGDSQGRLFNYFHVRARKADVDALLRHGRLGREEGAALFRSIQWGGSFLAITPNPLYAREVDSTVRERWRDVLAELERWYTARRLLDTLPVTTDRLIPARELDGAPASD